MFIFLKRLPALLLVSQLTTVSAQDYNTKEWTELKSLDGSIFLDLRYATTNNFVSAKMYDCGRCFLRPEAAKAVAKAHKILKDKGFGGLKMFDCYRPRPYQQRLWTKNQIAATLRRLGKVRCTRAV
ncbi:MAG: M15 family metallopeptidase [Saprospiraceae bacterium]|nr:M15 family metallopeptidase [Saprospiraceae bacterium]